MERPPKRFAIDTSAGLLHRLPADVWNYIVWTLLTPSERLQLRAACRFFHSACWRRGVSLQWPDLVQRRALHDSLNTWAYITEIKAIEAADSNARALLAKCGSLTSISFASADEQPSAALWLPPPSAFPRLKRIAFELDDCLTGELGAWACGVTSLTSVELSADDSTPCATWRSLAAPGPAVTSPDTARRPAAESDEEDSCASAEEEHAPSEHNLSRLPITSLLLSSEDPLPPHKLATIGRSLASRLQRLELRLGDAENPVTSPDLAPLALLSRLRALSLPAIAHAGRLRLPTLPALETLELSLHDTSFALRCVSATTSLRSLRLCTSFSEQRTAADQVSALRSLFNLTELNLSHSPEELDPHRAKPAELLTLSLLTSLTRIKLRANFEPSAADHLDAFLNFPQLISLELSYCDLRALCEPHSWAALPRLTHLSVLKLKGAALAAQAEAPLAAAVAALPSLSSLHLDVQPEWTCDHLGAAVARAPRLCVLSCGHIASAQLTALLPALTRLHSLSFWPANGEPPVDVCAALPHLRWLRFSPLTSWIELTRHPLLLLDRVPEACVALFYHYGYLRQQIQPCDAPLQGEL